MLDEPTRASARLYRATLEPLEPVSAVGSGDAFLAGYVAARYAGREAEDCLRFAVACGAESTQHFGAGVLEPREVERLVAGGPGRSTLETPARSPRRRALTRCWYARAVRPPAEPRILQWK